MNLKSKFSKLICGFTAAAMTLTMLPSITLSASAAPGDVLKVGNGNPNQHKSTSDGYSYEIWLDNTGGSGSMTLGKGATFKAEWNAAVSQGNFLARRGLDFGSKQKATDYGYIGMDYEATYKQTNSGGNSRLCVYGWFENRNAAGNPPLVEYYIIEDWVNWRPQPNGAAKTVTIDGGEYEIFAIDHTGPTIHGNTETFKQYFSVRKNSRTSGHITVSDHFKAWADQGWGIGNLYEVALNAEGWESSGVADVTKLDVYTEEKETQPTQPTEPPKPVEPDADGFYYNDKFESGKGDWTGRAGSETLATDSKNYYEDGTSIKVSGRTDTWHGVARSLDSKEFVPGNTYSFGTAFLQKSGSSETAKLTLEYSLNGEKHYDNIAEATAESGVWTKLENTAFTIPAGATGCLVYVETDSQIDFWIDNATGGTKGVSGGVVTGKGVVEGQAATQAPTQAPTQTPTQAPTSSVIPSDILWGDANQDGKVSIADSTAILQSIVNPKKYALPKNGEIAGDVDEAEGLTPNDALVIQQYDAGAIDKLPLRDITIATTQTTKTTTSTVSTTKSTTTTQTTTAKADPTAFMDSVRKTMNMNVPGNVKSGDSGKTDDFTYTSKVAGATKKAKVWTPPNYDPSKKYNVMYVNHGIFGDETSMLGTDWAIREMASNLIKSGDAEPFIIVFTQMYSGPGGQTPGMGFNMEIMDNYDKFLDDMIDSLMPAVAAKYSVKEGKDSTAIAGFSMGGRESLYLTLMRPDVFGYCCACSPAPGIVPAQDSFMKHDGSLNRITNSGRMQDGDFKIDSSKMPYLIMIAGGTNDGVVGTFPEQYHNLLTKNGTDHIWQSVPGGGHDSGVGNPMFYNFIKNVFKATGSSAGNTGNGNNDQPATTPQPNADGTYLTANFDSSTQSWTGRGNASVKLDSENFYSGKSLAVTGRTSEWNGAAITLDTATFVPGASYSISAAVLQKSGSTKDLKMTLQYSKGGTEDYAEVATESAKSGEWTKLENTSFTIPSGASDLILYVEAPDSLIDFNIDEVVIAKEGTKSSVVTGKGTVSATTTPTPSTGGVDISWIDPSKPMVAISFDDGASPATGTRIIDALADNGFHATFFYVGNWIRDTNGENEVKYAYSKGMEIANHTMSHPNLSEKSASEIRNEYDQCAAKLKGIIGAEPSKLLRLPYLASNNTVTSTLNDAPLITCAIDTGDWNNASKNDIVNKIKQAHMNGSLNGSIVLCHETYETTAAAMEEVLPYLKANGVQVVTISEMFAVKGKTLNGGQIYTKVN